MTIDFSCRKPSRSPARGSSAFARWLDEGGAPLLLAAVVAVMAFAAVEGAYAAHAPVATARFGVAE